VDVLVRWRETVLVKRTALSPYRAHPDMFCQYSFLPKAL